MTDQQDNQQELAPLDGFASDLLADPNHLRGDCQMITKAVRDGWPVTPERREKLLARIEQIIGNEATKSRTVLSAAKVLRAMVLDNLKIEGGEKPQQQVNVQVNVGSDNPIDVIAQQAKRLRGEH
jgi:hypothetical protein